MLVGYEWRSGNYQIWMPHDLYRADSRRGEVKTCSDVTFLEHTKFWDLAYRVWKSKDVPQLHVSSLDVQLLQDYMEQTAMSDTVPTTPHDNGSESSPDPCDDGDDPSNALIPDAVPTPSVPTPASPAEEKGQRR